MATDPICDGARLSDKAQAPSHAHPGSIPPLFTRAACGTDSHRRKTSPPAPIALAMEKSVLYDMVHHSEVSGIALVEEVILEYAYVEAMVRQLQRFDVDDDHAREELFEDMMQTVEAHFITESRDLLPRMNRSRDG